MGSELFSEIIAPQKSGPASRLRLPGKITLTVCPSLVTSSWSDTSWLCQMRLSQASDSGFPEGATLLLPAKTSSLNRCSGRIIHGNVYPVKGYATLSRGQSYSQSRPVLL